MSAIKNALDTILNCEVCNGSGVSYSWVSPDGDYDLEWCDCNPEHLVPEIDFQESLPNTCIGCNENKVSWDALYCMNCYLAKNAEVDYTEIDQLWLTKENA